MTASNSFYFHVPIIFNEFLKLFSRLTTKAGEFLKTLLKIETSAIPFFLLVDTFPGFAKNHFEKWWGAIRCFSKEFHATS
jgi:hypothetical protein